MSGYDGTLTGQLLATHLVEGDLTPGERVAIDVDQVLLQDVLGPLVWMEFEALGYDAVQSDVVATYADHQVYGFDTADSDTHRYLRTVTQRYGGRFSKPGNGICHQVHREQFIVPGATLLGSDSHSTTMGGFGALGIGAGGLDVAVAMSGEPYTLEAPQVIEVRLTGTLDPWVSAKDVVLELLRRFSVKGGVGSVFEFTGPGVESLSVPERCTIANMTTELGATSGVFPSDGRTRAHLERLGRGDDYRPLAPDPDATYADAVDLDLGEIVPLVATPSMPDNVVPVREVAGTPVDQVVVGSCTNGSYLDVATVAAVVDDGTVAEGVDCVVAPASKRAAELLSRTGGITSLYAAGVNLSESTCGACIGQGHVPAPDSVSLRAFNRNFEGRSGAEDDSVYLCSPEVAAASALAGELVDPRDTDLVAPAVDLPADMTVRTAGVLDPDPSVEVRRGETIGHVPVRDPLGARLAGPVLIDMGDNITTDHIVPATPEVMSLWSDPQACAAHTLARVDPDFAERAAAADGGWVVAGENYGQGSSRENAALELVVLGVDGVIAESFARIHEANLINFGVVPFRFADPADHSRLSVDDSLVVTGVANGLTDGRVKFAATVNDDWTLPLRLDLSADERATLAAGGKLAQLRQAD
jgi:aconitate hydratase